MDHHQLRSAEVDTQHTVPTQPQPVKSLKHTLQFATKTYGKQI